MRRIFVGRPFWRAAASLLVMLMSVSALSAQASGVQAQPNSSSAAASFDVSTHSEYPCHLPTDDGVLPVAANQVCGKLLRAENPLDATSTALEIHYLRLPAARRSQQSTLLFIQGGPGGASVPLAPMMKGLLRELNVDHDFLFVDLRGTGLSGALHCDAAINSVYNALTPAQIEQEIATCLTPLTARAQFYTTGNMVDDLEALRAALGIDQYKIWGVSYGARVALEYMRRYPAATAAVVLDSPGPVSIALPSQLPAQLQQALQMLGDECLRNDACARGFGHAWHNTQTLAAQLQRAPVHYQYRHPLSGQTQTYTFTRQNFLASLNNFFYARGTRSQLSEALFRATQGDWRMLVQFDRDFWSNTDAAMGLHMAVVCNEDRHLWPASGWPKILGEDIVGAYKSACAMLAPAALAADYFLPVKSAIPALIVSGEKDVVTPVAVAQSLLAGLSRAQHIIVKNAVHAVSFEGCMPVLITRFFTLPTALLETRGCENNLAIPPAYAGGLDFPAQIKNSAKQPDEQVNHD